MAQLRPEIATSSRRLRVYHLRRKGGREEIDIVVELPGVELIALEIKASASPKARGARHLRRLRDRFPDRILTGAVLHAGPDIRYLRHQNSGADPFDDMGPDWVSVRDGARDKTLSKSDASVAEVARRWDQLMRYTALRLEASIGETVALQLPAAHKDPAARLQHVIDQLASTGQMDARLC